MLKFPNAPHYKPYKHLPKRILLCLIWGHDKRAAWEESNNGYKERCNRCAICMNQPGSDSQPYSFDLNAKLIIWMFKLKILTPYVKVRDYILRR